MYHLISIECSCDSIGRDYKATSYGMTNLGCETLEDAIEVIGDKLVQEFALELAEHGRL